MNLKLGLRMVAHLDMEGRKTMKSRISKELSKLVLSMEKWYFRLKLSAEMFWFKWMRKK